MKRVASLFLVCSFGALPVTATASGRTQSGAKSSQSEECVLTPEDYAVYSTVLFDRGKPEDPEERWDDKPELLISDVMDSGEDGKSRMWGFRSASKQAPSNDTVDHFNSRRSNSCRLEPHLSSAISYSLISQQELDRYFKKKGPRGWDAFYKKHPKSAGYWSFSPVGYDSQAAEALVYVGHQCGGLCGTGHLYLLAKENGRWVVKNRVMLWIS